MSLRVMTQGGGGGESASIFVTGLSETDAVTATKGGKAVKGKWVQKRIFPDGYTPLEYIESTGAQYIDTGVEVNSSTDIVIDFQYTSLGNGSRNMYYSQSMCINLYNTTLLHAYFNGETKYITGFATGLNRHIYRQNSNVVSVDDEVVMTHSAATFIATDHLRIFDATHGTCGKLYSCQIKKDGAMVRDFVPCINPSDEVGLFDRVSNEFYTNAGTGAFVAGPEVPSTIDGHNIKIKEYGLWTVTATNGVKTTTQDVLVDAAVKYEIEIYLNRLYLYREGDECVDVTGGWSIKNITVVSPYTVRNDKLQVTKNENCISLTFSPNTQYSISSFGTKNTFDITDFTKVCFSIQSPNSGRYSYVDIGLKASNDQSLFLPDSGVDHARVVDAGVSTMTEIGVRETDISQASGAAFASVELTASSGSDMSTINIYEIWLE